MKTVVNNLVWLALFSLMVCASIYPQISGIAQAVIWVIVAIVMTIAPIGLITSFVIEGEQLVKLAGTKKGFIRRVIGWAKMLATFSAIAYAGFTVAAIFYLLGALTIMASVLIARQRIADAEKEAE